MKNFKKFFLCRKAIIICGTAGRKGALPRQRRPIKSGGFGGRAKRQAGQVWPHLPFLTGRGPSKMLVGVAPQTRRKPLDTVSRGLLSTAMCSMLILLLSKTLFLCKGGVRITSIKSRSERISYQSWKDSDLRRSGSTLSPRPFPIQGKGAALEDISPVAPWEVAQPGQPVKGAEHRRAAAALPLTGSPGCAIGWRGDGGYIRQSLRGRNGENGRGRFWSRCPEHIQKHRFVFSESGVLRKVDSPLCC